MPKRYRIDMTLTEEASGKQLAKDTYKVDYETDEEAKQDFAKKAKTSRDTGKPPAA
jgi:hypothetical protein